MKNIAVIGGGITGLTAALALQRQIDQGVLNGKVTLIEADDTLGGKIRTRRNEGFIMETGADSIVSRKPNVAPMIEELGLQEQVVYNATGKSFLYMDGELKSIPEDTIFGIPMSLESLAKSDLISAEGKVAALKDLYTPNERFTKNDSVGAFLTAFFGRELVERQIGPVLSGVYSGALDDLTIASTLPYLIDYKNEYGSIIKGLEANKEKFRSAGKSKFLSFSNGLSRIVDQIEHKLGGVEIRKGVKAERLAKRDGTYELALADGTVIDADAVILATLHTHAQQLLNDEKLDELFGQLTTSSLISIYLGYDVGDDRLPEDGTGFITTDGGELICNACTWTSRKWTHTSAQRRLLVRMFYKSSNPAYATLANMTEAELLDVARRDVEISLGIREEPVTHAVTKWHETMPNYHIRHHELVSQLEKEMAVLYPNVILAGCSYYGVGIPDCMANGASSAEKLLRLRG